MLFHIMDPFESCHVNLKVFSFQDRLDGEGYRLGRHCCHVDRLSRLLTSGARGEEQSSHGDTILRYYWKFRGIDVQLEFLDFDGSLYEYINASR